jgi:hypothetical protein
MLLFATISNSSSTGLEKIEIQILKLACPLPLNGAVAENATASGTKISYDIAYDTSSSDYHVTVFTCVDGNEGLDLPSAPQVNTIVYTTANNWFNIGLGYLFYISEVISNIVQKILAVFTLMSYILTPINFNILGYTIEDIGGLALMFVIGVYIFCYIGIGVFLYKTILPTGGVS